MLSHLNTGLHRHGRALDILLTPTGVPRDAADGPI